MQKFLSTYRIHLAIFIFFLFLYLSILPRSSHAQIQIPLPNEQKTISHRKDLEPPKLKQLHMIAPDIDQHILRLAKHAYCHALEKGEVKKPIMTVIDYHLASSEKRLWVIDLKKQKLLFNTYVAHGKNSGDVYAHAFSNTPESKASSIGTFVTSTPYIGSKGLSLNLQGLEAGFNDNAYARRVVMHGAWYVDPHYIHQQGHAGRSWGCPAVSPTVAKPIINTIKNGTVLFAYYPNSNYLHKSEFI